jgi:hypothetical protein
MTLHSQYQDAAELTYVSFASNGHLYSLSAWEMISEHKNVGIRGKPRDEKCVQNRYGNCRFGKVYVFIGGERKALFRMERLRHCCDDGGLTCF